MSVYLLIYVCVCSPYFLFSFIVSACYPSYHYVLTTRHIHILLLSLMLAIEILGVAVLPPSVCILLELCKYGSLSDLLRPPQNTKNNVTKRNRLNITYLDLLWLAIGCCRGLCALHACGPDVCHRDIKSMNFLGEWNVDMRLEDRV